MKILFLTTAHSGGVLPMLALKPESLKVSAGAKTDAGGRKQRIVRTKELCFGQLVYPVGNDLFEVCADRKESRDKTLAGFGADCPGILIDRAASHVYMAQRQRGDRIVPGAAEQRKGEDRAIAPLQDGINRHCRESVPDLFNAGDRPLP